MKKMIDWPVSKKILFALVFTLGVFIIQFGLSNITNLRFLLLYPSIFSISWLWGFPPALLSIILATLAVHYLMPIEDASIHIEYLTIAIFFTSNVLIAWMVETSRKRERELKDEMASILENMQDAFVSIDRNMIITMVNNSHLQMSKTKRDDNIGKNIWEVFPPAKESKFYDSLNKVMHERVRVDFVEYYPPLDLWTETSAYPIDNGGLAVFSTDITERKKFETELVRAEGRLLDLADSIPHIVWTATAEGVLDFCNKRFYEYTGKNPSGPISERWDGIIHPDDMERMTKFWNHSMTTGEPYHIEYRLREKSGNYRWHLGLALLSKDEKGKFLKWFGSCTDIHDQKMMAFETENALRTRDEFLSIASHELKTPLTSLRLNAQMFQRMISTGKEVTPENINNLAFQVDKQVSKLNHLVDDMLDISRIRTGKLVLRKSEFDLCELISEVMASMKSQYEGAGFPEPLFITNKINVPLVADKVRIEQVLINLFSNALRYGNKKAVVLTLEDKGDSLLINLRDNGIGIAEEHLEVIFDRFEKIRNTKEISGLGLGLYISKQIILAHGGKIWAESSEGAGSDFKIILPKNAP